MKIYRYGKLSSTQVKALRLKRVNEPTAIIADRQTGGKGTKGRKFISEKGGVYLSLIKPYPCAAKDGFKITCSAAVAVVKTLAAFGINAEIKWPNDIYACGKKICGILIENTVSGEEITKSVIGVGININNEICEELRSIAISAKEILNKELDVKTVAATLIYNLLGEYDIDEYREKSLVIGKKVTLTRGEEKFSAEVTGISDRGELQLKSGEIFSAAEIIKTEI